jgi:hypothetical protein
MLPASPILFGFRCYQFAALPRKLLTCTTTTLLNTLRQTPLSNFEVSLRPLRYFVFFASNLDAEFAEKPQRTQLLHRIVAVQECDARDDEQRCERRLKKNSFTTSSPASENNVLIQSLESSKFTDCPASTGINQLNLPTLLFHKNSIPWVKQQKPQSKESRLISCPFSA